MTQRVFWNAWQDIQNEVPHTIGPSSPSPYDSFSQSSTSSFHSIVQEGQSDPFPNTNMLRVSIAAGDAVCYGEKAVTVTRPNRVTVDFLLYIFSAAPGLGRTSAIVTLRGGTQNAARFTLAADGVGNNFFRAELLNPTVIGNDLPVATGTWLGVRFTLMESSNFRSTKAVVWLLSNPAAASTSSVQLAASPVFLGAASHSVRVGPSTDVAVLGSTTYNLDRLFFREFAPTPRQKLEILT